MATCIIFDPLYPKLPYLICSEVGKFAAMMGILSGSLSPLFMVVAFAPLNRATTRSLMAACDLGSSIANGRLLLALMSAYFSVVPLEYNRAGWALAIDKAHLTAVVFPVPEECPKAIGIGQKKK